MENRCNVKLLFKKLALEVYFTEEGANGAFV